MKAEQLFGNLSDNWNIEANMVWCGVSGGDEGNQDDEDDQQSKDV